MNRQKIMAAVSTAAFFSALGIAGAVEQGAPLIRMLLVFPLLAVFAETALRAQNKNRR